MDEAEVETANKRPKKGRESQTAKTFLVRTQLKLAELLVVNDFSLL